VEKKNIQLFLYSLFFTGECSPQRYQNWYFEIPRTQSHTVSEFQHRPAVAIHPHVLGNVHISETAIVRKNTALHLDTRVEILQKKNFGVSGIFGNDSLCCNESAEAIYREFPCCKSMLLAHVPANVL
jgi:hypothetical protein